MPVPQNSPLTPPGLKDNKKNVLPQLDCIGNSLSRSLSPKDSQELEESYVDVTGSPVALKRRNATYGRKTLESKELNLNLEEDLCEETFQQIGTRFENRLKAAISEAYPQMFIYGIVELTIVIIGGSLPLLRTIKNLLQLKESFTFIGAELELAKVSAPGKRLVYRLIARIPGLNGGAATAVKSMLLSMNFEEHWTSPTFCDGLTATQCVLSQKDLHDRSLLKIYGLPAMWIQGPGTPI